VEQKSQPTNCLGVNNLWISDEAIKDIQDSFPSDEVAREVMEHFVAGQSGQMIDPPTFYGSGAWPYYGASG
jgi:hypothetical protein